MLKPILLTFLAAAFSAAAADAPPLVVDVGTSSVTIRNVTAGHDVAVLAVAIESNNGLLREISGGFRQTDERVTIARNFFKLNDVVVNGQHIDASKLSDKQVMEAFASFNATWRNAGPAAQQVLTSAVAIPATALSTLQTIDNTGAAPQGYKGGRQFQNDGRGGGQTLPKTDANSNPITYREWDVNPSQPGVKSRQRAHSDRQRRKRVVHE